MRNAEILFFILGLFQKQMRVIFILDQARNESN